MLQVRFLGDLPTSEREALAQQIADMSALVGGGGMAISQAVDLFRLVPDEDRDDIARRAISLGADASSVRLSLQFAREADAKAVPPPPPPAPTPARDTSKTWWIVASVLAVTAAGVTIWSFARRRRRR